MARARRLYEQGGDKQRLWEYVTHWYRWLHGGLKGSVTRKGGIRPLLRLHLKATWVFPESPANRLMTGQQGMGIAASEADYGTR